ncbi:serine phosphatase RsbU, regulator of sigma subunit [Bernardetia litoralis DSM 6794]|uniref:Serine phosphatase RsbU, regulator of sigma subunit n=1 Tax=Bernardetia litoralis (strain ATCC 23117 / DSM 6794 / NBRC 15988 / NCIMB 1366 / Fx l1 / Sio-4) TaxID=880071 RepID=I4AJS6_BERLS|nr:7TM diverse intracellular signaling domain-containing protein [Bernardetia litoralis]AFM04211.1 serine phosphatase RsbU, regulator of sigma subunit [Bernardetia litoralis DSM 6794]
MTTNFILVVIFLYLSNSVFAQSIPTIFLEDSTQSYTLTDKTGIFREKNQQQKTIESIQKVDFTIEGKDIITVNNDKNGFWFKIPIHNKTLLKEWYLEIGSGHGDLEFYIPKMNNSPITYKKVVLAEKTVFSERLMQTDRFLLPLYLLQNQSMTIFVRGESNYFQAPIHIAPLKYYFERDHKVDIAEGIYYGFVIVMFLYNLFVFFTLRERGYLYYVGYLFFFGLAMAQIRGHGFEFLWFSFPFINHYAPLFYVFGGVLASLFLIDFLNTQKNSSFFHITLHITIYAFVLAGIASLLGFKNIASYVNQAVGAISTLNSLAAAIYVYYTGYKPAKYIIVAWSGYLLGILLFVLAGAEIIPYTDFTSNGILFGSAVEMILLSVALAARIEFYKKGREELQAKMLKTSEEHREFVETQNKRLEERVVERTEELNVVNEELSVNLERLHEQNIVIEKKNHDITASINYAKRIQQAMLPSLEEITSVFSNSFVFFEPRDIVSGDFYYFQKINTKVIIGAIDCTGHGVPGAFMSLIGNDLLNEIVERESVTKASHILDRLDEGVTKVLRQTDTQVRDGMDAAFCVYDLETQEIEYAGARNPLIYIENGELKIIKADRQSVGGNLIKNQHNKKLFTNHTVSLTQNTSFYLCTDGFQDQFGGTNDKKFTIKRFREVLLQASKLPFVEQQDFLKNTLKNWMGYTNRQIDDILVFGFEVEKTK